MSETIQIKEDSELLGNYKESQNSILLRYKDKNFEGHITETDDPKLFEVRLEGQTYSIRIKSRLDEMIDEMGLNVISKKDLGDVFSPMPGLVIDILVEVGQTVESGQPLVILEAMKMENIIKAQGEGRVSEIKVIKGEKIDKAQLLIRVEASE